MALAIGRLRLPPATFWSLTPRELRAVLAPADAAATARPSAETLTALMARFPDL